MGGTAKIRRRIGLPASLVAALSEHRVRQMEERLGGGPLWDGNEWDLVFTKETGHPICGNVLTRTFQRHLSQAGLPVQRFHDCRHAAASFALAQGVDIRTLQEVLGHSSRRVTGDVYGHLQADATRLATEKSGAAIAG